MLSEYEAATLAKQTSAEPALRPAAPARNRIGAVLLALSVVSALGLLYTAFFHRGPVASATRAAPAAAVATPIIHPIASGLPEGVLFLRRHPREAYSDVDARASEARQVTAGTAALAN